MEREEFHLQFQYLMANIHDYVILEKHPFGELIPRSDPEVIRSESLRRFIEENILSLKPRSPIPTYDSLEWRYFHILSGRYIEGVSVFDLQKRLSLGERQVRRLNKKALIVLENIFWERLFPELVLNPNTSHIPPVAISETDSSEEELEDQGVFQARPEPLHLDHVLQEVITICTPRIQPTGTELLVQVPSDLPVIRTDRIILRQILLHMLGNAIQSWVKGKIGVFARMETDQIQLIITVEGNQRAHETDETISQGPVQYWLQRLNASLSVEVVGDDSPGFISFILSLPRSTQAAILVVDDHEPAIRIIQRFLSHTNLQVIGITDPLQVMPVVQTVHPQAVLLDVMMPSSDGWEILQAIKADPESSKIPVIVCSIWSQPELAYSLGANGFLKKPISQSDLMDELMRSHLLDTSGE